MKFLIKIEEVIDALILKFIEKMKHATPHFVYATKDWITHSPQLLKSKISHYWPKIRLVLVKSVGYFQHYFTMFRGHIVGFLIYLKSDEFKAANKVELITAPIRKFKTNPLKAFTALFLTVFFTGAAYMIYLNTQKIFVGTKALRAPASAHIEEEPILEFKKIKYTVLEKDIFLDVTLTAPSIKERDNLLPIEKDIEELLQGIHLKVTQLPISEDEMKVIKKEMMLKLSGSHISHIDIKQVMEARPKYFLLKEKQFAVKDVNLQLFLEDTKRNRQVYVDFTALASNRNAVLFLKDHEVEVRDFMNMNVEPVIPQLPVEEEGRQIIKDKIRDELNQFLKDNGIEARILEVYIDYIMVS